MSCQLNPNLKEKSRQLLTLQLLLRGPSSLQQSEAAKLAFALEQNEELLGAITECLTLNRLHDAVR